MIENEILDFLKDARSFEEIQYRFNKYRQEQILNVINELIDKTKIRYRYSENDDKLYETINNEFRKGKVKKIAELAGYFCSNPGCGAFTVSPSKEDLTVPIIIGEAAHINGNKQTSARYDENLSSSYVRSLKNGIWLCCNCHKMIDANNGRDFSASVLKLWKEQHSSWLRSNLNKPNIKQKISLIQESESYQYLAEFNQFQKYLYEIILDDNEVYPFRPNGPMVSDFKIKNSWVYIPSIVSKIIGLLKKENAIIIRGKPATGKTVITRSIGFNIEDREVFYIDFLTLNLNRKKEILDELNAFVKFPSHGTRKTPLFIFENIHDPEIEKIQSNYFMDFISSLKVLSKTCKILLTTRGEISKTSSFSWIPDRARIDLDALLGLNIEIIEGILDLHKIIIEDLGLEPELWNIQDEPENLWLLGWNLRLLKQNQIISFKILKDDPKQFREILEKYYFNNFSKYFDNINPQQILTILLIISITSKYEIYCEEDFIITYSKAYFKGLETEDIRLILNILSERKEILKNKIIIAGDPSILMHEYRIPHIKLAEILQSYYTDKLTSKKLEEIFEHYIENGINSPILGYNLWNLQIYEKAFQCFKLSDQEENTIRNLLKSSSLKFEVLDNLVVSIDLSNNELEEIPKSIGNLNFLQELNLSNNEIFEFPLDLTSLSSLKKINLNYNGISEIYNITENLTSLEVLSLEFNEIESIPSSIERIKSLRVLNLGYNNIKSLPDEINSLNNLRELYLRSNKIEELPINLENLTSLTHLTLSNNHLTIIPNSSKHLRSLRELDLERNKFVTFPEEIENLEVLSLAWNNIENFPESIANLKKIWSLDLTGNQMVILPEVITNLKTIERLNLSCNKLKTLPDSIINLKSLKFLEIFDNPIENLPQSLGDLKSLKILVISTEISERFRDVFISLSEMGMQVMIQTRITDFF